MRESGKGFCIFACVVLVLAGTVAILNQPPLSSEEFDPLSIGDDSTSPMAAPRAASSAGRFEVASRVRDIERMVFAGVSGFDHAEIRRALHADFDLSLAAHPGKDLFEYLALLEKTVATGYRHGGFPDAAVEVLFNRTRERVEVRVDEGPRYRCGEVQITGADRVPVESILQKLTPEAPTIRIKWKPEAPAPFDDQSRAKLREIVSEACAAAGFFSPEFDIAIHPQAESGTAKLAVTIRDEGPLSVVGPIEITGTNRDSADDVIKFVELEAGAPFGSALPGKLTERLKGSGRYLSAAVTRGQSAAEVADGRRKQGLRIELVEYKGAPPLLAQPSPVEHALLRFSEWIERWSAGETDDDLVVTASADRRMIDPVLEGLGKDRLSADVGIRLRTVIGPRHGWVLKAAATRGETPLMDVALVAEGDRIVLVDLDRRVKAEFSELPGTQLVLAVSGDTVEDKKQPFRLKFGVGARNSRKPDGSGIFAVRAEFVPAFMLSMARFDGTQSAVRDGICEIHSPIMELRLEAATGRLIEWRVKVDEAGLTLSVQPERGALQADLTNLDPSIAGAVAAYDRASPWKSVGEFLIDESARVAERSGESETAQSLHALGKVLRHWSIPNPLALLELSDENLPRPEDRFWLPDHRHGLWINDLFDPGSNSRKSLASVFLHGWRQLVPRDSWLEAVGSDLVLNWVANDPAPARDLQQLIGAVETGPTAAMLLGSLPSFLRLDLRSVAGRAGLERLSAADFANDYEPLLTEDSPLGKSFLSLAEALRQLNEPELRALLRLLPAGAPRERITQALLVLQADRRSPVESVVPQALDRLWLDVFQSGFQRRFSQLAGLRHPRGNPLAGFQVVPYDEWGPRSSSWKPAPPTARTARRDRAVVPAAATSPATNGEPPAIPAPDPD